METQDAARDMRGTNDAEADDAAALETRGAPTGGTPRNRSGIDRLFKITERGSTVGTEIVGGITTFLAMAYIIAVNPVMLEVAGVPFTAGLTATCFGAALMTLLMGLIVNRPVALASGMGLNAFVAYTICLGYGADWRVAMGVVAVEGIVIVLLMLVGLRNKIMHAVPVDLRHAIGVGIGIFIAFIGLINGGIVVNNDSTLVSIGSFADPVVIVSLISIVVAVVLTALKVRGALIISIIVATAAGIPLGVTQLPTEWSFGLDFSAFAAPLQTDPATGTLAIARAFSEPVLLTFAFSMLMSDFFDTMGSLVAIAEQGKFLNKEDGSVQNAGSLLMVDSFAAFAGGFLGASSITTYIESTAGAAAGARTGLSNVVIAICFFAAAFIAPIVGMVSGSATCGALVVVGYLIIGDIVRIDWKRIECALPAFLTIITIPLTYSITNGIGLGFISYCILMAVRGKAREVSPLMWVVSVVFLLMFIFV